VPSEDRALPRDVFASLVPNLIHSLISKDPAVLQKYVKGVCRDLDTKRGTEFNITSSVRMI
jgi:hypothetical protein